MIFMIRLENRTFQDLSVCFRKTGMYFDIHAAFFLVKEKRIEFINKKVTKCFNFRINVLFVTLSDIR